MSGTIGIANSHLSSQNFSVKDVLLFEEYLFVGLLELFDWAESEWHLILLRAHSHTGQVSFPCWTSLIPMLDKREMAWEGNLASVGMSFQTSGIEPCCGGSHVGDRCYSPSFSQL